MDFQFYMTSRLLYGAGCVEKHSGLLPTLGKKCLIVTGSSGAAKSGALGDITKALDIHGIKWEVFSEIGANPLLSSCKRAGYKAKAMGADFLVGIGGGSAIDGVKAAALYAANNISEKEIYALPEDCAALPVVLIGTTAGSGSEVTNASVLTDDATGVKKSVSRSSIYAAISFCDPRYTHSLSSYQTLSTALDAFSHSVESYLSIDADHLSSLFALDAVKGIYPVLKAHSTEMAGLSTGERDALFSGSILAGLAINRTGTCFPHPLGYVVTEYTGIPHGLATAAFLPAFMKRAARLSPEKLPALEAALGESIDSAAAFISCVTAPALQARISEKDVDAQAKRLEKQKNYDRTPGGYTGEDAVALMKEIFAK